MGKWVGCAFVGVLPAGPLVQLWEQAIGSADWRAALELGCQGLLGVLRPQLLGATEPAQGADIFERGPTRVSSKLMWSVTHPSPHLE